MSRVRPWRRRSWSSRRPLPAGPARPSDRCSAGKAPPSRIRRPPRQPATRGRWPGPGRRRDPRRATWRRSGRGEPRPAAGSARPSFLPRRARGRREEGLPPFGSRVHRLTAPLALRFASFHPVRSASPLPRLAISTYSPPACGRRRVGEHLGDDQAGRGGARGGDHPGPGRRRVSGQVLGQEANLHAPPGAESGGGRRGRAARRGAAGVVPRAGGELAPGRRGFPGGRGATRSPRRAAPPPPRRRGGSAPRHRRPAPAWCLPAGPLPRPGPPPAPGRRGRRPPRSRGAGANGSLRRRGPRRARERAARTGAARRARGRGRRGRPSSAGPPRHSPRANR